jgi:hypothetical protein
MDERIPASKLNIGCGKTIMERPWLNLDKEDIPGVDYVYDLDSGVQTKFTEDCFEEMLMSHILEHVKDPLGVMEELHRIARPDCLLTVRVPYGSSDSAWEDPQHIRPYFLQSFEYFGQPCYWRADYRYRGDWQVEARTLVINENAPFVKGADLAQLMDLVTHARNVVLEFYVELRAVKPIREMKRELAKASPIQFSLVKGE